MSTVERISVPILQRLRGVRFAYAELNASALVELERRIAAASQAEGVISYARLVDGIPFRSTTREFTIAPRGFTPANRKFITGLLGELSRRTYERAGFFASAAVVRKDHGRPNDQFFEWAYRLGALVPRTPDAEQRFFEDQLRTMREFYRTSPPVLVTAFSCPGVLEQESDGQVYVAGSRVTLQDVVRPYQEGYSPEMILGLYPTLSLSVIHKVIAFYLDNASKVDRYLATEEASVRLQREAGNRLPGIEELRGRLLRRAAVG